MRLHYAPVLPLLVLLACGGVQAGGDDDDIPDAGNDPNDTIAPAVLSVSPDDGASGVTPDATITIAFTERMDRASVEAAWRSTDLPPTAVTFAWNAADDTLTVTPKDPLPRATGVGLDPSVVVPRTIAFGLDATAADVAGNPLASALAADFRTERQLTVNLAPIGVLTRTIRADGVVFGETAVTLVVGDSTGNLQTKSFASFTLTALPAGSALELATLGANQNSVNGNPYGFGPLAALHVTAATIDAAAFTAAPLGDAGALSANATAGAKSLDVTTEVAADLAAARIRSQFRLEFANATNGDGVADEARLSRTGLTLALAYTIP